MRCVGYCTITHAYESDLQGKSICLSWGIIFVKSLRESYTITWHYTNIASIVCFISCQVVLAISAVGLLVCCYAQARTIELQDFTPYSF